MKKILLIDDDKVFLKTVSDSLSTKDYKVIVAKDGEEGFQQRFVFRRRVHVAQDGDGGDQQGIVGQR